MKVYINGEGHVTKMAAMAKNSKRKIKSFFSRTSKAYNFETWHEASGIGALQSLYKSSHWDDFDLFYGRVNIDRLCI